MFFSRLWHSLCGPNLSCLISEQLERQCYLRHFPPPLLSSHHVPSNTADRLTRATSVISFDVDSLERCEMGEKRRSRQSTPDKDLISCRGAFHLAHPVKKKIICHRASMPLVSYSIFSCRTANFSRGVEFIFLLKLSWQVCYRLACLPNPGEMRRSY